MKNYLKSLGKIMSAGWDEVTKDQGGVRLLLGQQLRFVLAKGFPLLTTREMDFDKVLVAAFDVLKSTNVDVLVKRIRECPTDRLKLQLNHPESLSVETVQVVTEGNFVHFILNYESIDYVVDLPFAIAVYALVAKLIIREIGGHYPGELVVNFGRGFIKHEHFAAVNEQINRRCHKLSGIVLNEERATFRDMLGEDGQPNPEDVRIEGYTHWEPIKL